MKQHVMKKGVSDLNIRRIDTGVLRVNDQTFPIPEGGSLDILVLYFAVRSHQKSKTRPAIMARTVTLQSSLCAIAAFDGVGPCVCCSSFVPAL
jgi:hypothetical protein